MTTAQAVIDRAREILKDDGTDYRETDATLLGFLTLAQREVLKYKPEALARQATFTFASTESRQRLSPETYYRLLRVESNYNVGQSKPGSNIRTIERDLFDSFFSSWPLAQLPAGADGTRIKVVCMDAQDPLAFWTFPRPQIGEAVLVTAVAIPADITLVGNTLALHDNYIPALTDYVVHMALRSEERGKSKLNAQTYLDSFLAYLGRSRKRQRETSIELPRPPEAKE